MARPNAVFVCGSCGGETLKWQGQCPLCGEWNSLEQRSPARARPAAPAAAVSLGAQARPAGDAQRFGSGQAELDRVLGGGIVPGSVILLGGDPGIGKSTLLLQVAARVAASRPVIYASGEE
jgi:DNA repair protein RadA/Sms